MPGKGCIFTCVAVAVILLTVIVLIAIRFLPLNNETVSVHHVNKAETDKKEYSGIELRNGLKALLVSDNSTEKAAVSVCVHVGTMSSPRDFLGLPHFLEHMLFLGTKKYPVENHFDTFISTHGGESNAQAAYDWTCYFYDINSDHLNTSLDIFSQFFKNPLLRSEAVHREVVAVDSEHRLTLLENSQREFRLYHALSDNRSDYSKFNMGNIDTLITLPGKKNLGLETALREFFHKYYSANLMTLCIFGKESLDDLTKLAVEKFSEVPNRQTPLPTWPKHPFTEEYLGIIIKVVPVKQRQIMEISFPCPDLRKYYRSQPDWYISTLVAHKGEGGLYSYLHKNRLVTQLTVNIEERIRGFSIFRLTFTLTKEGFQKVDQITTVLFEYLHFLRSSGPQKWFFEDGSDILSANYKYSSDIDDVLLFVYKRCPGILDYPWEDAASAPNLLTEFSPSGIERLLKLLVPENSRIMIVSKDFQGQTNAVEEYLRTEYSVEKISPDRMEKWKRPERNEAFHFPKPNNFIPRVFSLVKKDVAFTCLPVVVVNEPWCTVWFFQDTQFLVPKSVASFEFRTPLVSMDAVHIVSIKILLRLFLDSISERFQPAKEARYDYEFLQVDNGMKVKVEGYSDKQLKLLIDLLMSFAKFKVEPSNFKLTKVKIIEDLKNAPQLGNILNERSLREILGEGSFTVNDELAAVNKSSPEVCQRLLEGLLHNVTIKGFLHGNLKLTDALSTSDTLKKTFTRGSLNLKDTPDFGEYKLKNGVVYKYSTTDVNEPSNIVIVYYQVGQLKNEDLPIKMANQLLCAILKQPFYDNLRTIEQLGYTVRAIRKSDTASEGIKVLVKSGYNVSFVEQRIFNFMNVFLRDHLHNMTVDEFMTHKKTLITSKSEKDTTILGAHLRLWSEITEEEASFHIRLLEATAVEQLTKKDILEHHNRYVTDVLSRRVLVAHILSQSNSLNGTSLEEDTNFEGEKYYKIADINKFRLDHELFE